MRKGGLAWAAALAAVGAVLAVPATHGAVTAATTASLLPPELCIPCAAFLSLVLGGILVFSSRRGAAAEREDVAVA